jgi:hypothetical protein
MGLKLIPANLRKKFTIEEREHAISILKYDFSSEWQDILDCLDDFWLTGKMVKEPGGSKSSISKRIDGFLQQRGWAERSFDTKLVVDGKEIPSPTHKIDNFKNSVGVKLSGTIRILFSIETLTTSGCSVSLRHFRWVSSSRE